MSVSALLERLAARNVPGVPGPELGLGTLEPAPLLIVPGVPGVPVQKVKLRKKTGGQAEAERAVALESAWKEIETLPLLAEDRTFIRERISLRPDGAALLARYVIFWRASADGEPVDFRKANRGRVAANTWLRRATELPPLLF